MKVNALHVFVCTGGVDFTPVSVELLFEQPEVMCINISVLDDIFFEGAECLTVILEETDGNVILNISSARVVIEDRVSCIIERHIKSE